MQRLKDQNSEYALRLAAKDDAQDYKKPRDELKKKDEIVKKDAKVLGLGKTTLASSAKLDYEQLEARLTDKTNELNKEVKARKELQ